MSEPTADEVARTLASHAWQLLTGVRDRPLGGRQTIPAVRCQRCRCFLRLVERPTSDLAVPFVPLAEDAATLLPCPGHISSRNRLGGWSPPGGWVWRPVRGMTHVRLRRGAEPAPPRHDETP